jgi:flagellar hook-associated protein 2
MTTPLSSFTGVVSGFDYQSLVSQIITLESRPATQARQSIAAIDTKLTAIQTYRGLLTTLKTAASALRDGSAFDSFDTRSAILTGTKNLGGLAASSTAAPGTYELEVSTLARAEKLTSGSYASTSADLGLAGTITINGKAPITIAAADSLAEIRDRINAANSGTGATKVTASILTVGASSNRLILTSDETGAAGMTLADTTGSALQSLGFLSAPTTQNAAAVQVNGTDAAFRIDGVSFTRSSNTVTDAIAGVTLTLANAEDGAITTLQVSRSKEAARAAAGAFVDAYNKVLDYIKQQSTAKDGQAKPTLYGDPALRSARGTLPQTLLQSIAGASADLATAGAAGLSLGRDGKLSLDTAKFDPAFTDRLADLRRLFMRTGTATDAQVTFIAAGNDTVEGSYAVNITTPASQATCTGVGFGGTYSDDGTPDTMTVTDTASGRQVQVALADGMTTAQIVSALNAAFGAQSIGITAAAGGGELTLTHGSYGAGSGFSVAFSAGGDDGTGQLGLATGAVAGTDVAGTIGGEAATGIGQILTASAGKAKGLAILYTGNSAPGAAGTVTTVSGTGALIERQLDGWADAASGTLAQKEEALRAQSSSLDARALRIESRMERRRTALLAQFQRMEASIARLQAQSSNLISSLGATSS